MPEIRLLDIVLLSCDFEVWPTRAEIQESENADEEGAPEADTVSNKNDDTTPDEEASDDAAGQFYPDGEFLQLEPTSWEADDEYYLVLGATIDDASFPFRLYLQIGTRFYIGTEEDEIPPPLEEAEPTLVWLSYPYLRETISAISGRSPLPPYILPAITKLPHPSVTEDE